MSMPRPSEEARAYLDDILPPDGVEVRPMFGNVAAFAGGNMFSGLFGDLVFVRLAPEDRAELLQHEGAGGFEPMAGRPMKEYVTLPPAWCGDPEQARAWVLRALQFAAALPPKPKKSRSK